MVAEGGILLGIEHLQQRRGRVALIVAAELVNLVEQQQRVFGACVRDRRHDAARHCADVGLSVAADLRLVVYAAEGYPRKLTVERACNGDRDGGLADTGRADKAEDLPRKLRCQLTHGQRLQNAFLDLFEAVMVGVQNFARLRNIQPLLRRLVPRKLQHSVQIIAQKRRLLRAGRLLRHAPDLLQELFLRLLLKMQLADLLAVAVCVVIVRVLAKLLTDHAHLLAQIIVPLILVHVLLNTVGDLVFEPQDIQLLRHQRDSLLQSLDRMQLPEQLLLVLIGKRRVLTDEIRRIACVLRGQQPKQRLLHIPAGQLRELFKLAVRLTEQRLHAREAVIVGQLLELLHPPEEIGFALHDVQKLRAVLALDQNAHVFTRQAQHLLDDADRADGIQIVPLRMIRLNVLLRHKEDLLILPERLFDGRHGRFAAHIEMRQHLREHAKPAQRQHRQTDRTFKFAHKIAPFWSKCTKGGYKAPLSPEASASGNMFLRVSHPHSGWGYAAWRRRASRPACCRFGRSPL